MIITSIVPIVLTVGLGFLLECRRTMDLRALSSVTIYVLLPCLVFYSLSTTELTLGEALPVVAVLLLTLLVLWVLGKVIARARRLSREDESFLLLTTMFLNAGNMGMPIALYAFGQRGLDLAVIGVLAMNLTTNTVAVYYASRHLGGHRAALRTVFSLPTIYAAALALLLRGGFDLSLPGFLLEPIRLLGFAAIPLAQLLLGIQLAKARTRVSTHLAGVLFPSLVRLLVSPAVAFVVVTVLGISGLTARVALLISAMPTAVNIAIYTTEFHLQPRRTATAVFTSTVISFVTLSGLLFLLSR